MICFVGTLFGFALQKHPWFLAAVCTTSTPCFEHEHFVKLLNVASRHLAGGLNYTSTTPQTIGFCSDCMHSASVPAFQEAAPRALLGATLPGPSARPSFQSNSSWLSLKFLFFFILGHVLFVLVCPDPSPEPLNPCPDWQPLCDSLHPGPCRGLNTRKLTASALGIRRLEAPWRLVNRDPWLWHVYSPISKRPRGRNAEPVIETS